jgi:hypothetical protein
MLLYSVDFSNNVYNQLKIKELQKKAKSEKAKNTEGVHLLNSKQSNEKSKENTKQRGV